MIGIIPKGHINPINNTQAVPCHLIGGLSITQQQNCTLCHSPCIFHSIQRAFFVPSEKYYCTVHKTPLRARLWYAAVLLLQGSKQLYITHIVTVESNRPNQETGVICHNQKLQKLSDLILPRCNLLDTSKSHALTPRYQVLLCTAQYSIYAVHEFRAGRCLRKDPWTRLYTPIKMTKIYLDVI